MFQHKNMNLEQKKIDEINQNKMKYKIAFNFNETMFNTKAKTFKNITTLTKTFKNNFFIKDIRKRLASIQTRLKKHNKRIITTAKFKIFLFINFLNDKLSFDVINKSIYKLCNNIFQHLN